MSSMEHSTSRRVIGAVRYLRTEIGMSQQELSGRVTGLGCPMTRNSLANLETGRRQGGVTVDELEAFATALGVMPIDLLSGEAVQAAARLRVAALRAEADRISREAGLA